MYVKRGDYTLVYDRFKHQHKRQPVWIQPILCSPPTYMASPAVHTRILSLSKNIQIYPNNGHNTLPADAASHKLLVIHTHTLSSLSLSLTI